MATEGAQGGGAMKLFERAMATNVRRRQAEIKAAQEAVRRLNDHLRNIKRLGVEFDVCADETGHQVSLWVEDAG